MDKKLYVEVDGKREALVDSIELLTPVEWEFGLHEITEKTEKGPLKTLAREELKGKRYTYHLREPHGGTKLQELFAAGKRFNLVVAYGQTTNVGRKRAFVPFETYLIAHLIPHGRVITHSNHVDMYVTTLETPERIEV